MRYRLYVLDHNDRVKGAEDLLVGTDNEALALANASPSREVREVWLGESRIARIEPEAVKS